MKENHTEDSTMDPAAEWCKPSDLVPWSRNPRRNAATIDLVAKSISEYGFGSPVVARRSDRRIIIGHTRVAAAKKLKLKAIPVRFVELDDKKAEELAVIDNKSNEKSAWDIDALVSLDLDLVKLGWTEEEIREQEAALNPGKESGWRDHERTGKPGVKRACMVSVSVFVEDSTKIERAIERAIEQGAAYDRAGALVAICEAYR